MADDNVEHTSTPQVPTGSAPAPPPRWSAAKAAREAGVARSTIHEALRSGRLEATKDDHGAWQITPMALIAAGYSPGRPTKVHEPNPIQDRDDGADVPAEVHRLMLELTEARADARVLEVRASSAERERDMYRRMLEAPATSPTATAEPAPLPPVSHPTPTGAPPRRAGRFRRAWNVARYS